MTVSIKIKINSGKKKMLNMIIKKYHKKKQFKKYNKPKTILF